MPQPQDIADPDFGLLEKPHTFLDAEIPQSNRLYQLLLQFMRYVVVGGLAFVADYTVFNLLINLKLHYLLATVAGFCVGVACNYALCVLWVWRGTRARSLRDIAVFTLIGFIGLLLTSLLMWLAVDLMAFDPRISKAVVALVILFWNFGLRRVFVFFK